MHILSKTYYMERMNEQMPGKDSRTFEYQEANDRHTHMTDLEKLLNKLEAQGFVDQYKVEKGKLHDLSNDKKYKARDVKAVNFYRFEGNADPEDMSILYAIETSDGRKGTLIDAYGLYADEATGAFLQEIEISKKVNKA
jgi:hypothetical protein